MYYICFYFLSKINLAQKNVKINVALTFPLLPVPSRMPWSTSNCYFYFSSLVTSYYQFCRALTDDNSTKTTEACMGGMTHVIPLLYTTTTVNKKNHQIDAFSRKFTAPSEVSWSLLLSGRCVRWWCVRWWCVTTLWIPLFGSFLMRCAGL